MQSDKVYTLSDWPVLEKISARTTSDRTLDSHNVTLLYEVAATDDDWAAMDQEEYEFAKALLASRHRRHPLPSSPFKATCPHCSEVVVSWHKLCVDVPKGEKRGLVFCGCGRTGADSADVEGVGRIIGG